MTEARMDGAGRQEQVAVGIREGNERLREAVKRHPRKMTLQLAREYGVPEVEVIRAFPSDRAVELDSARWEDLIRSFEALGPVRVLVSSGAATLEVVGQFGGFSTTGEFFNVQSDSLDLHIRWRELAAAFAVEKPSHMDGRATYSVQFFDRGGAAALKVFWNFGEPIPPERFQLFRQIRERFRAVPGEGRGR
jgi:putative hemin transport protein